ncbi:MAG: glutathione S-transferase family protein [Oligoflexia bacterium]|nr:glutathione S-transferase family protein [Oligoflexia bacterium]
MMKLFYSSGACSSSCHIGMEEAGLSYQGIMVDWDNPDANLAELERLNPLGVAPVLVSDQGKVLTQNTAILEYIADLKPSSHLLAEKGTWERVETMSWLSFAASDFHKSFIPLFRADAMTSSPAAREDIKKFAIQDVKNNLAHLDRNLVGKDYITGKNFTVADAYIFVVTGWCKWMDIKIDEFKNLGAYMNRVYQRPAVQKVLKSEGLLD